MCRLPVSLLPLAAACAAKDLGPGAGPWREATPESQGLDDAALRAAEARVNAAVPGRRCFLVVKNGAIVHETYHDGWTASSIRSAASVTKSLCSELYGIATQQGWADPNDLVRDRNGGSTRQCNADAEFLHVLTMTGQSTDLTNPQFRYDASGACLDALSDFIAGNNPDGLSAEAWKDRYFHNVLGMEHSTWQGSHLRCGSSAQLSCRDLARAGQLWANAGEWPGAGQLVSREHIVDGSRYVFPSSGQPYGYTVWLRDADPVDPEVAAFYGAGSQCAHVSREHETVIVSMGPGDAAGSLCSNAWTLARDAIVSKDHRWYNRTRGTAVLSNSGVADIAAEA